MKNQLKIGLTYFFAAFIFLLSCGFSVSHVYCSKGEQWVIGSQMPPKKNVSEGHKAKKNLLALKKDIHSPFKHKDHRKKETFDFRIVFVTDKVQYQENNFLIKNISLLNPYIENHFKAIFYTDLNRIYCNCFASSNSNNKPELSKLQVFII